MRGSSLLFFKRRASCITYYRCRTQSQYSHSRFFIGHDAYRTFPNGRSACHKSTKHKEARGTQTLLRVHRLTQMAPRGLGIAKNDGGSFLFKLARRDELPKDVIWGILYNIILYNISWIISNSDTQTHVETNGGFFPTPLPHRTSSISRTLYYDAFQLFTDQP